MVSGVFDGTVFCISKFQSNHPKLFPHLLDIQSNLLDELRMMVVMPLCPVPLARAAVITQLCPIVGIESRKYLLLTQQIAGIDRKALGKKTCDLAKDRQEIMAALDFIVSGI